MEDWLAFQEFRLLTSKQFGRGKTILIFLVFFINAIYAVSDFLIHQLYLFEVVFYIAVSVGWGVLVQKYFIRWILRRYKKIMQEGSVAATFGEYTLNFSAESLRFTSPAGESTVAWNKFYQCEENEKYLFLYLSALSALIIPKLKVQPETLVFIKSKVPLPVL